LLDDVRAKNPGMIKQLAADAELRRKQVESIRQLLAFACQAVKDRALDDLVNKNELENIRREVVAVNFDNIRDKRPSHTQFDLITKDRVAEFYKIAGNEPKFDDFLDRKSTRLNSSHGSISYAVFCLKKKNI